MQGWGHDKDMITKDIIYDSLYNIFVITIAFKGFLLSETLSSNKTKINMTDKKLEKINIKIEISI